MHDCEAAGATGEGHVKSTHARWRLGDDPGGLDDDDRVELEALGVTQREQADLGVEGSGTDLTADDALADKRRPDICQQRGRHEDTHAPVVVAAERCARRH